MTFVISLVKVVAVAYKTKQEVKVYERIFRMQLADELISWMNSLDTQDWTVRQFRKELNLKLLDIR